MKVIIPVDGETLDSPMNRSFGRSRQFILVDSHTLDFEIIPNEQNMNAAQGAGIQAAQTVIRSGGDAVVTARCGPKAFRVLTEGGVKVYTADICTIKQVVEKLVNGKLDAMMDANIEGHWV